MIVLDSGFLIGFYNSRDAHHTRATSLRGDFLDGRWGNGLLLEYVYLEVVTVLLTRAGVAVAIKASSDLLESKEFEFFLCSDLFAETVRNFTAQQHEAKFYRYRHCNGRAEALGRPGAYVR